jgi:hypothetical protein
MKPMDSVKLALLLVAVTIWFVGYRTGSRPAMMLAIALVVTAFLLRFVKGPPSTPEPPAR